jgi:hypothetical protein
MGIRRAFLANLFSVRIFFDRFLPCDEIASDVLLQLLTGRQQNLLNPANAAARFFYVANLREQRSLLLVPFSVVPTKCSAVTKSTA